MRKAYITLSNDSFFKGVIALHNSLIKENCNNEFVVLYYDMCQENIDALKKRNITVKEVQTIPSVKNTSARLKNTYTKLHVFNQDEYDKVIFIDADAIVLKNIDHLFNLDTEFSAAPDNGIGLSKVRFNTGVMVVKPNKDTFQKMMECKDTLDSYDGSDQGFLNSYFGHIEILDMKYNTLKRIYKHHKTMWEDIKDDIHILHYVGRKPWETSKIVKEMESGYEELDKIWFKYE